MPAALTGNHDTDVVAHACSQIGDLIKSIPTALESRSKVAMEDQQFREAARKEYEERYKSVLRATTDAADFKVSNIRAQSEFFLTQKTDAVRAVSKQLASERSRHAHEVPIPDTLSALTVSRDGIT